MKNAELEKYNYLATRYSRDLPFITFGKPRKIPFDILKEKKPRRIFFPDTPCENLMEIQEQMVCELDYEGKIW